MKSNKWDTRISAARALGGIVANSPKWDPNGEELEICRLKTETNGDLTTVKHDPSSTEDQKIKSEEEDESIKSELEDSTSIKKEESPALLIKSEPNASNGDSSSKPSIDDTNDTDTMFSFATFDLKQIINKGKKLVASAGSEFDQSLNEADSIDHLRRQKLDLKRRLGMGNEYLDDEILTESDLTHTQPGSSSVSPSTSTVPIEKPKRPSSRAKNNASPGPSSKSSRTTPEQQQQQAAAAITQDPISASNARLRAMARRRAKNDAKNNQNKVRVVDLAASSAARRMEQEAPLPSAVKLNDGEQQPEWTTTEQAHNDKVVIEHKAPKTPALLQMEGSAGRVWPFEGLCELLMIDLFDSVWEVRHGAALGLREVIKVHGAGAGRVIGKTKEENDERNRAWLEDLSCRLCCVFALDRFGDYVADQVVAPVRESAAQTLGALLLHLQDSVIKDTFDVLCRLVLQTDLDLPTPLWEACHGGMLGLRYLVSVRNDILFKSSDYLDGLISCVIHGLKESDDDVQAMSAATLIPISNEFITLRSKTIPELLEVLWNCLAELRDELSASIGNVMDLLAKLSEYPQVLDIIKANAEHDTTKSFSMLVPRLSPFLRHSITNVRKSVLRALLTFLAIDGPGTKDWINHIILRLIFQNLLVEQNEDVLNLSLQLWNALLDHSTEHTPSGSYSISELLAPYSASLLTLLMTPIGASRTSYKMDTTIMIKPSGAPLTLPTSNGNGSDSKTNNKRKRRSTTPAPPKESSIPVAFEVNIDSPMLKGDVTLIEFSTFLRTRIASSKAYGRLIALWEPAQMSSLPPFDNYLFSTFSTQRLLSGIILEEYGYNLSSDMAKNPSHVQYMGQQIGFFNKILNSDSAISMYRDFVPYLKAVRTQCLSLFSVFVDSAKLSRNKIPQIAVVVQGEAEAGPESFSIETAVSVANVTYDKLKRSLSAGYRITHAKALDDAHRNLLHSIQEAQDAKSSRDISVFSSIAAAYVSFNTLPKKLNPIIRSLMDSVKGEEHRQLQLRAAASISRLVSMFVEVGKTGASDKIVRNLCSFLCVDTSEVPEFHPNQLFFDKILSLRKEEAKSDPADIIAHQREVHAARIKRLGAQTALENMTRHYGADVFSKLPKLQECMFKSLPGENYDITSLPADIENQESTYGQDIIDALSVIRALLPFVDTSLHDTFKPIFPLIQKILAIKYSVLRYAAAKCFASICSVMPITGITFLVENILSMVSNAVDIYSRQGAVECIYHLTATMGSDILPYVVFLIVPVLGRMSDADQDIRLLATTTFASIIKLVPLESGIPDPPGMSGKLLEGRDREREFISQMLDVSKVQTFKLPVAIKASLRSYQQEGVNWLAFLNKYHLHGILCDDMGLGKTLQTICIIASDHHLRAEEHAKTQSPETRRLPSIIVCPPTLTGHWMHEFGTYAPFIKCLCYVGPPSVRQKLIPTFNAYDVIITSYDITRNDIPLLSPQNWNYCALDEGHIIRNASSKLTQAVKKLVANHRLILSGTPIQNNVLELWSLFDFLMPGFLGTEKVFNDRFAKPIAASRNSKSSSKEQEAGALALEALHKQVLPFLLRRLKEDVLSDLPPKIIQDYYCELSDLQKQLYESFAKKQKPAVSNEVESKEGKQHIFQALQYMRKLCNHPALIMTQKHPQYDKVMHQLHAHNDNIRSIQHAPKLLALQELLKSSGIGANPSAPGSSGNGSSNGNSSNINNQLSELNAGVTSQHRALIFCQLKDMLDIVENDLLKKYMPSVTYMRLDGSKDARIRHEIVQKFNSDPSIDVLLLTTHVGGLGLNLTGADTVIFVEHDWNPMNDLQAMDRAHRIGQKKVVNVYRLITRGTLEEKIMGLQKFKLNIASTVINQQNSGLASMDTDQLLDLFETDAALEGQGKSGGSAGDDEGALDETGQIKNKGSNPIGELSELWDEKDYEEEYNMDNYIQSLKM